MAGLSKSDINNTDNLDQLFLKFLSLLYKQVYGDFIIRSFPPILGNGENVDLWKLFLAVRERGGYEEVSKTGLWQLVARDCGYNSGYVPSLKLVYVKYLDLLNRWLKKIEVKGGGDGMVGKFGRGEMELEPEFSGLLSEILAKKGTGTGTGKGKGEEKGCFNEEVKCEFDFEESVKVCCGGEHYGAGELKDGTGNVDKKRVVCDGTGNVDEKRVVGDGTGNVDKKRVVSDGTGNVEKKRVLCDGTGNVDEKRVVGDGRDGEFGGFVINRSNVVGEKRVVEDGRDGEFEGFVSNGSNVFGDFELKDCDGDEEVEEKGLVERSRVKESYSGWKRKRGCCLALLKWIRDVAKDPGNKAFGTIPEMSKWKSYGNYHTWKQVLFVREQMFLSIQQSFRENRQMHPAMYEDSAMRCSARVALVKESRSKCQEQSTGNMSDSSTDSTDDFWVDGYFQEPAQLGPDFQADVPEWKEATEESDSKWLGSQIFPHVAKKQNTYLIERERIGKGRDDTCGCPSPGSLECVRFHICEKRKRVKCELGPAFYEWKFDVMGEDVTLSWTREDGKKFQEIVKANPFSEGMCFWDELLKAFPSKKRAALVSYYFNVFLVERRGYQNRETPSLIDSDDDESELCLKAVKQHHPGSILCSPKKV